MAAAAVRGRVREAHAERAARVVAGELEVLDLHGQLGHAVAGREGAGALGQLGADPLATGDQSGGGDVGVVVAEAQAEVGDALLRHVGGETDHGPGRDGVHAEVVAGEVEAEQRLGVADAAVGAAEGHRLELGTLAVGVADDVVVAAADRALAAGALLEAHLLEGRRVDLVDTVELALRPVAGRHRAGHVHHVDERQRALFVRPHVGRREDVLLVDAVEVGEKSFGVADPDRPGAADGDRLDVLRPHQGAGSTAACLVRLVGRETGPRQQVLSRGAVGHGLHARVEVRAKPGLQLADLHAHVGRGGAQLDDVVLDPDQRGLGGAAGDDDLRRSRRT